MDSIARKMLKAFDENILLMAGCMLFFTAVTVLVALHIRKYWREHGWTMRTLYTLNLIVLAVFTLHIGTTILHLRLIPTEAGSMMCAKITIISGALLFTGNAIYTVVMGVYLGVKAIVDSLTRGCLGE